MFFAPSISLKNSLIHLNALHIPCETLLHFIWKCTYHYLQPCTLKPHFSAIMNDFYGHHSLRKLNWKFRVDIVKQSFWLSQEFRTKKDILASCFLPDTLRIANRNGALNHHDCFRVILHNQVNDILNGTRVKMLCTRIIVCRCCDYDKIRSTTPSLR